MKAGNEIGLYGVDHRVRACPRCQAFRQAERQFRIEKRQRRLEVRMPYTEFHTLSDMGDHGGAVGLGTCASRRRNGNQPRKGGGDLGIGLLKLESPEIDLVVGRQTDGLAAIHGAAAANGDYRVICTLDIDITSGAYLVIPRIRRDVREQSGHQAGIRKKRPQTGDEGQVAASPIGDHQRAGHAEGQAVRANLGKPAGTIGNRHGKMPVLARENVLFEKDLSCSDHRRSPDVPSSPFVSRTYHQTFFKSVVEADTVSGDDDAARPVAMSEPLCR